MKVNIVMDNKNNWFYPRRVGLIRRIKELGHTCAFYSHMRKVPRGSDVTFYLGHEGYIGQSVREKSRHNIVVHASDLPKGKGMSPATWQILEGKRTIPVTLFEVAPGFDTGDYYFKRKVILNGGELIDEWQEKLGRCIEEMMLRFVREESVLRLKKQRGKGSVYRRRTPADSELDPRRSIAEQFNLLRVVDNQRYPAFFRHKKSTYVIKIYKKADERSFA